MSFFILAAKIILLLFWFVFFLSALKTWDDPWRTYINWAGLITLAVHIIEAAWFVRRFGGQLSEPKFEKMQVLVFGVLHWWPALKTLNKSSKDRL